MIISKTQLCPSSHVHNNALLLSLAKRQMMMWAWFEEPFLSFIFRNYFKPLNRYIYWLIYHKFIVFIHIYVSCITIHVISSSFSQLPRTHFHLKSLLILYLDQTYNYILVAFLFVLVKYKQRLYKLKSSINKKYLTFYHCIFGSNNTLFDKQLTYNFIKL